MGGNEVKKNCVKSLVFLSVLVLLFILTENVVTIGLKSVNDNEYKEWNDVLGGKINSDIIIQGSSRAWVHISPKIIEEKTGYSCYNLGIDGYAFDMQLARNKMYMQNNIKPKMIIQSLDNFSLARRENQFNQKQFLPYFDNKEIRNAVEPYGYFDWFDYNLPLVRYIRNKHVLLYGVISFIKPDFNKSTKYNGYQGKQLEWDGSFEKYKEDNPNGVTQKVDEEIVNQFDEFLENCKNNNIEVVLVYSPEYYEGQILQNNREEIMDIYRSFAKKYSIKFLDYSSSEISFDKEYFYNSEHLNKMGSEKFTKMLAEDIFN